MTRGTNQLTGTYTIKFSSEPVQASGVFQALNISGSVAYNRMQSTISFSFAMTDPPVLQSGQSRVVTGSTTYNANNPNQLVLPQFTVSGGGATYTVVGGCTLSRSGSRYTGKAILSDGVPETSWGDFVEWVIEINDANDWDSNGIPDLTDSIPNPPFVITPPQSQTAILSSNVSFTVTASGSQPLSYQWQAHGTNKPGATASTMTLTNVQLADAGEYRVVVSNGGGSTTSQVAVLSVIFPPSITDQPVAQSVIAGETAQFAVAANGSDPLYYQWRRQGTNLPGETFPILLIQNAQPPKEGGYSVVVSNAAGIALSSTVTLTVTVPPAITSQPQSLSVPSNVTAQLQVGASGTVLSYYWKRNGSNWPSGGLPTLTLNNVQPESGGVFSVTVSNRAGMVISSNAVLYVGWPLALTNVMEGSDGSVRTDVIGRGSTSYVFQSSFNLSNWVSLATNNARNGLLSFTNPPVTPVPTRRFLRVKVN
jgi:hypothetical protein